MNAPHLLLSLLHLLQAFGEEAVFFLLATQAACSSILTSPYFRQHVKHLTSKTLEVHFSLVPFLSRVPSDGGLEECAEVAFTCKELVLGCFVDSDLCIWSCMLYMFGAGGHLAAFLICTQSLPPKI